MADATRWRWAVLDPDHGGAEGASVQHTDLGAESYLLGGRNWDAYDQDGDGAGTYDTYTSLGAWWAGEKENGVGAPAALCKGGDIGSLDQSVFALFLAPPAFPIDPVPTNDYPAWFLSAPNHRHDGKEGNTNCPRVDVANGKLGIHSWNMPMKVQGLRFVLATGATAGVGFSPPMGVDGSYPNHNGIADACIFEVDTSGYHCCTQMSTGPTEITGSFSNALRLTNCIQYGSGNGKASIFMRCNIRCNDDGGDTQDFTTTVYVDHCSTMGSDTTGLLFARTVQHPSQTGDITENWYVRNCLLFPYDADGRAATQELDEADDLVIKNVSYNVSSDADSPGDNGLDDWADDAEVSAGNQFGESPGDWFTDTTLGSGDATPLQHLVGVNLRGTVDTDILLRERTQWDAGAFQFVPVVGSGTALATATTSMIRRRFFP